MRRSSLAGWLVLTLIAAPATPAAEPAAAPAASPSPAPAFEAYRFNARERTARALAAWQKGRPEEAVEPLDTALRLAPGDPLAEYNAGTAHLGARASDAVPILERAAKHAPATLAADAFYNLGNARLQAKDAAGALESYKSALRAQPDLAAAKRNLELALRMLDEQQKQQQEQQQKDQQQKGEQGQDSQQDPNQPSEGSQGEDRDSNQPPREKDAQSGQEPQQSPPQPGDGEPQPEGESQAKDRPLPQFEDQQDMTAEQAAAILQAVENLERQQRRDQARALARAKTSVEKDW
jgi:Ca-activated chloride channel family protein